MIGHLAQMTGKGRVIAMFFPSKNAYGKYRAVYWSVFAVTLAVCALLLWIVVK
jgi:hypothetical protein